MQIPTGENFGNRLPQLRQTNIARGNTGAASLESSLKAISDVFTKIAADKEAITTLELSNQLNKRNQQLDELMDDWQLKIQTGEMSEEELQEAYKKALNDFKRPDFKRLNEYNQKNMSMLWDESDYVFKSKTVGLQKKIQFNTGANQLSQKFISLRQEVMKPGADPLLAKQQIESEEMNKVGLLVYGNKWQQQKAEESRQIDLSYIQGRINRDSANKDTAELKSLKEQILDTKQFPNVDAFERNKFIGQIDSQLNLQGGASYAQAMTKGLMQLITKTNDTQTAGVYLGVVKQIEANQATYTMQEEHIKNFVKESHQSFDAKRYATDKSYREELGQAYFASSLNKYGSPILAATAYMVGDKKIDEWLKEYGDPRTKQLSDEEFVGKITNPEVKKILQEILQQKDKGLDSSAMIEAVDNDPNLNKEQKMYAKREIKLTCDAIAEQQNNTYLSNLNKQWCEVHINNKNIVDLPPEEVAQVRANDLFILKIKPPKPNEYDESEYSIARARVKMGRNDVIVREYGLKLPVEKTSELLALKQQLKNNPEQQKELQDTFKLVESIYKDKSFFHDYKEPMKLFDLVSEEIDFRKKQNRPMSPIEIKSFIRQQLVEVKIRDSGVMWNDSKYLYQTNPEERAKVYVKNIKELPTEITEAIKDELKERGIPITEDNILNNYNEILKLSQSDVKRVTKDGN